MNRFLILTSMILVMFSGCTTTNVFDVPSSNNGEAVTPVLREEVLETSIKPSATISAGGISTMPPTKIFVTVTSTPSLSNSVSNITPKTCTLPPQRFNTNKELGINSIASFRFDTHDVLTFEGWVQRPEPSVTPITPEPTPDMYPEPNRSSRQLLVGGQIDIPSKMITLRPLNMKMPIHNPCEEACPLDVIAQSPNQEWQLVQVSDWLRERMGIWLVSEGVTMRLIPYVPGRIKWQWSTDNSLLWMVYSDPDLGGYSLVIDLIDSANNTGIGASLRELPVALDPWANVLAFSPTNKLVFSTTSFEFPQLDTNEVFTTALADVDIQPELVGTIPGLVTLDWNETTQSVLMQIVNRDESGISGIEIQDVAGNKLLILPQEMLTLFGSVEQEDAYYYRMSDPGGYALSESGSRLAVLRDLREIWIFDCDSPTLP